MLSLPSISVPCSLTRLFTSISSIRTCVFVFLILIAGFAYLIACSNGVYDLRLVESGFEECEEEEGNGKGVGGGESEVYMMKVVSCYCEYILQIWIDVFGSYLRSIIYWK